MKEQNEKEFSMKNSRIFKRVMSAVLAAGMVFSMTACGGGGGGKTELNSGEFQ